MRLWPWASALVIALGCGRAAPRAYGEVVMVVDGDWPDAAELERLRIDVYAQDGQWFATRDVPDFGGRPLSFSVYSDDESRERFTWVRLRAYPSGRLRDVPASGAPRLVTEGVDVTPATEPDQALAVDRLVLVRLRPGEQTQLAVTLRGACAGAAAILRDGNASRGPVSPQARTCLDDAADPHEVVESVTTARGPVPAAPRQWGVMPCDDGDAGDAGDAGGAQPGPAGRICIPGGPMLLGTSDLIIVRGTDPTPERLVLISRFFLDRDEVTVGRYRAALAAGLPPADLPPASNPGPLGADSRNETVVACTWSSAPLGREEYPLDCIGRAAARAYCTFMGGDLPSEAQWEYAASVAGRTRKASYAWGDDAPDCARAVYGRAAKTSANASGSCVALGAGPRPIAEYPDASPLGVRGLAGGLTEWTLDKAVPFGDRCWASAPRQDPSCLDEASASFIVRGGAWDGEGPYLRTTARFIAAVDRRSAILGFRCAYQGAR